MMINKYAYIFMAIFTMFYAWLSFYCVLLCMSLKLKLIRGENLI